MDKRLSDILYELSYKTLIKYLLEILLKTILIIVIITLKRTTELIFELLSAKVFIPLIVLFLFTKFNFNIEGTAELVNLITGSLVSAGVLFYKYKKDIRGDSGKYNNKRS